MSRMKIGLVICALATAVAATGCGDDGSEPSEDTGTPPGDTGMPPGDTGTPPGDTGTPPGDTGTPPGDAGAGRLPVVRSAGCGSADPATGERTVTVTAGEGAYIVSLPSDYDPTTAYPLGFGFHGAGRTHAQCQSGDCRGFQSVMQDESILVYIKSFTDGWPYPASVRDDNVELFEAVLDILEAEYCVDQNRIFVAGTSSGASFSNVLACRFGDRLLAAVPVAGGLPERDGCVGRVAALVIHGVDDYHVEFSAGEAARDFFISQNGCTSEAVPDVADLHGRVVMNRESHECADYQGCEGPPVRWCEHSEGGYDGSTHGWPDFGGQEIWDFVRAF